MTFQTLLIFLLMLAATGLLLTVVLTLLMTRAILCPPRMTDGKAVYCLHRLSPGDLGLVFDNQWFNVRDARGKELKIAAWWIPAAVISRRCVVLIHGYADAKVGSIAWAPLLHQAGLNILAVDLRAHGESGGVFTTGGFYERDDLNQVINQLLIIRPGETEDLILFGASLGAVVSAAVACGRDDLSAVILESPFPNFRGAILAHAKLLGLPGGAIVRTAIELAQWISGAKFDSVRAVDTIPRVGCPVLAIVGSADELLTLQDVAAIRSAVDLQGNRLSQFWLVEDAGHLLAAQTHPLEYAPQLERILQCAQIDAPVSSPL